MPQTIERTQAVKTMSGWQRDNPSLLQLSNPNNPHANLETARNSFKDPVFRKHYQSQVVQQSGRNAVNAVIEEATTTNTLRQSLIEQADLTSSDTGVLNKLFGGEAVWPQVNVHANAYGMLPKFQTGSPSFRAKTAFADSTTNGVSEGTVPTAVTSTYDEVEVSVKEHANQMRISGLQQDLVEIEDAYGSVASIQRELAIEHAKGFERSVVGDVDSPASNDMESVDRVTADDSNATRSGDSTARFSAASDPDIYDLDRSSDTWSRGVMVTETNPTTANLGMIDEGIRTVHENGGNTTAILCGWDWWETISDLSETRGRWDIGVQNLQTGNVNDGDVPEGLSVSTLVNHYQGRPIVASDQVPNLSGELSRLYGLDLTNPTGMSHPRLGVYVANPTQVYTAGERSSGQPQAIGFLGDSLLAVTRHQTLCTAFDKQFSVWDATKP